MTERNSIRAADFSDAKRLLEIHAHYVGGTAVSLEYDVPSLAEFETRMRNTLERCPHPVIEKNGKTAGYACAGAFVGRQAYDRSCELSVYPDRAASKHGLGRRPNEALKSELKKRGFPNLYACIAHPETEDEFPARNRADFYARMGFPEVGRLHKRGYKFSRRHDMIRMKKLIGESR